MEKITYICIKLFRNMNKKKTVKNIKTPNKFDWGGDFKKAFNTQIKDMFSGINMGTMFADALPGIANAAGSAVGNLISGDFSTTGGQVMSGIGDIAGMIPGVGMIAGPALKVLSGLTNRAFGTNWNDANLAKAENNISNLSNFVSTASSLDELMNDFNSMSALNNTVKASDLGKDGWLANKTQDKARELNKERVNAYSNAFRNITQASNNISSDTLNNLERNYAAFGGPLFAYGGQTHGSDFTNGLMFINNGGTHESNPYEGVPISTDQEGNPNLVEEGEVIWNDYVFSDRLKVPKAVRTKYKLRGIKDMTFADAVNKISKESEERPNDPISKKGLDSTLVKLALEQEIVKQPNKDINNSNKFSTGGDIKLNIPEFIPTQIPTYSNNTKIDISHIDESMRKAGEEADREIEEAYNALNTNNLPTWMRYAPVMGNLTSAINNIFQKPDYSTANSFIESARNLRPNLVKFTPIGGKLGYTPFDTSFALNNMRAQNMESRRRAMNTSGGNRATAMANILALDREAQNAEGSLYQKALEYNLAQKQKIAEFNNAIDKYNTEEAMKAALANQAERSRVRDLRLETLLEGYKLKGAAKDQKSQAVSNSLSGLFQSLGDIGYENFAMNQINWGKKKGTYAPGSEDYNPKG